MFKFLFFMLIIYFFLTYQLINYTPIRSNSYNYYELAVQKWCTPQYNIHGLWPQIDSTHYPADCSVINYNSPTGSLLYNMTTYWHSCSDNDSFWKHEWEKHGSCFNLQTGMNEEQYFNIALQLYKNNYALLKNCVKKNCIIGCFDLNFNLMTCPI